MTIQEARPSDHQELSILTKTSKAYWGYSPEQMEKWDDDLTISEAYIAENEVWKLDLDDQIIGYYSYWEESPQLIKLDNLFLLPSHIGQGYGHFLLTDCMNRIKAAGYTSLRLDADPHAETFYAHYGFQVVGQLPTSIKDRFLPIMQKDL